jgi:hypothetical protein
MLARRALRRQGALAPPKRIDPQRDSACIVAPTKAGACATVRRYDGRTARRHGRPRRVALSLPLAGRGEPVRSSSPNILLISLDA